MIQNITYENIAWVFNGNVWGVGDNFPRRTGGPECAAYFTMQYKIFACLFKVM